MSKTTRRIQAGAFAPNFEQLDTRRDEAKKWIQSKGITKVLMNPPFENKYGCIDIVMNTLDSVTKDAMCAFIMPDKKMEKVQKAKRILKHHTLLKVIKLPENIFSEGITTSIFIFKSGTPHGNREIFACYIEDDGLETVKNQGRQDVKDRWQEIEDYWVEVIQKQSGDDTIQWIKPNEHLSYQMPIKEFEISEEDFNKTVMDYLMFQQGIDVKTFQENLIRKVMYSSTISQHGNDINISLKTVDGKTTQAASAVVTSPPNCKNKPTSKPWREFLFSDLFYIEKGKRLTKANMRDGDIRFIGASAINNGVTAYIANSTHLHPANTITVNYNGSVGEAFYQDKPFWASDDVNVLHLKTHHLSKEIALFLIPLIRSVGKRFKFDEKWTKDLMNRTKLKLPVDTSGTPDWSYMEDYISTALNTMENNQHLLHAILR